MALTNWNDILNKPKGIDEVPEIALSVEQLSASVLSISEDVGEIAGDVQEIALEVSQLSASVLPISSEDNTSTKEVIDNNKKWKLLEKKNLESATNLNVNLPQDFEELYIDAEAIGVQLLVPKITLSSVGRYFQSGFDLASNNYAAFACQINNSIIGYTIVNSNGSFTPSVIAVYYR